MDLNHTVYSFNDIFIHPSIPWSFVSNTSMSRPSGIPIFENK